MLLVLPLPLALFPSSQRTVYVDKPELGYPAGNQEIPPGGSFELAIEVLSAGAGAATS
jgi:hypothetical protein